MCVCVFFPTFFNLNSACTLQRISNIIPLILKSNLSMFPIVGMSVGQYLGAATGSAYFSNVCVIFPFLKSSLDVSGSNDIRLRCLHCCFLSAHGPSLTVCKRCSDLTKMILWLTQNDRFEKCVKCYLNKLIKLHCHNRYHSVAAACSPVEWAMSEVILKKSYVLCFHLCFSVPAAPSRLGRLPVAGKSKEDSLISENAFTSEISVGPNVQVQAQHVNPIHKSQLFFPGFARVLFAQVWNVFFCFVLFCF